MATVDDKKIIFSMVGVSKTIHQTNKQVLKNIYLSFFYGAKIGIIGLNGSGKSTLMKIIAGQGFPRRSGILAGVQRGISASGTAVGPVQDREGSGHGGCAAYRGCPDGI